MVYYGLVLFALLISVIGAVFILYRVSEKTISENCEDSLNLSSYIFANKLDEARILARVYFPGFPEVLSYSGFLQVSEKHDSNMFFWYFPSLNYSDDPLLLWLQGGPGTSSLWGLFHEHGPFHYVDGHLQARHFAWNKNHHVLYVDNPVGAGFSYTNDGYAANQTDVGRDLYSALYQFFELFPELRGNEFYVAGESYAGKYVPSVCYTIHQRNHKAKNKINLQGFAIGNGWTDPVNQLMYAPHLYQLGLIDDNGYEQVTKLENECIENIKAEKWRKALGTFYVSLIFAIKRLTGFQYFYNFMKHEDRTYYTDYENLFKQPNIRCALHVGNKTFSHLDEVWKHICDDMMKSVADWVAELLGHYRGVFYSGQLDILVAYPQTENFLRLLNFSAAAEWSQAERRPWRVAGELAGYAKTAGNLTEVLVRNAGHAVPVDQPEWAADLITRLTRKDDFF